MNSKKSQNKNDYKSIAHQINNGKNKDTTQYKTNRYKKEEKVINQNIKLMNQDKEFDKNAFVMIPINHPKINEIIKLLNQVEDYKHEQGFSNKKNSENEIKNNLDNKKSENNFKLIITLNDIMTNISNNQIIIPENSIITPLAKDYIKQKKVEIIYTKN